jgi:hypothetical protein
MHHPYAHPDTVAFLRAVKKKYRPDFVLCLGDEVDHHAISFHDSDPDLPSAGDELEEAIKKLRPLYKLFPKMVVLESNHGSLVYRKAFAHGLPKKVIKSYNEILEAPKGWKWVPDLVFKTPLGPVYSCHGKSAGPGKLASLMGMSCVQGHHHSTAQIYYISTPERLIFDMHSGCLVDDKSLAMAYNKLTIKRPIISCSVIINGVPEIVPMVLNKKGRWKGTL